ncbi:SGNH/GDSL hydrolase family protein [Microbacterium sp. Leaf203]|uniref:SGNH/GDSL hydrolase family protein n=1 Tax=Microbacterium sp. Leaf203 TaxID=1735677 RepID=UPI0006FEA7DA|nr:SGNH/GDSL hydrolase family protein [Microbacterium sp. Leaf203]KQM38378.1 hypothetical protein ASE56_13930 [Microbacterium sp. Leaf203]
MGKRGHGGSNWWTDSTGGVAHWLAVVAIAGIVAVVGVAALIGPGKGTPSADYTARPAAAVTPTPTPTPVAELTLPESPRVLMLGDSYMQGTGADDKDRTWARQVANTLGWNADIDGVGGTGFTVAQKAGGTFADRLASHAGTSYDLVLIEGGQNDHAATPEALTDAVRTTVERAKQQWPNARVVVMGPAAPQPLGDMLGRMATPIENTARQLDALTINPVASKWMTEANSEGFDFDGAHVNQAGHDYIAGLVSEQFRSWLTPA